jgi:tetratricopeptide (TPR) repeat protein
MKLERFDAMIDQAKTSFVSGELETAFELFAGAEKLALEASRQDLADRAFCSKCAVLVEFERIGPEVPKLQEILLRSQDQRTRYMAAYYTAVAFDLDEERERAVSFANRAFELASSLNDPDTHATAANLLGNLALVISDFAEAENAYREALAVVTCTEEHHRLLVAQFKDNLGYTLMCTDRAVQGIELCEQSRDELRVLGATHYLHQPLQDLCYGYLLEDRLQEAELHGEEGLELALAIDDRLVVKNSLFLLAEASVRRGNRFRARRFLSELSQYYPDVAPSDEMIDVLLAVDLTRVVNLRS